MIDIYLSVGLVVMIPFSGNGDPGSIPGLRAPFCFSNILHIIKLPILSRIRNYDSYDLYKLFCFSVLFYFKIDNSHKDYITSLQLALLINVRTEGSHLS